MIAGLSKLLAIALVGYCCLDGVQGGADQVAKIVNLPKRIMTVFELKQIQRLISYDLVDGSDRTIVLADFCREELSASGRDPGTDYWLTPYRLFFKNRLYDENSSVTMSYTDAEHYVVVSAGMDKKFISMDDLTSKSDADEEVQELTRKIEAAAKRAAAKKTKSD